MSISKYKKLTQVDHCLTRPGMYIGSTINTTNAAFLLSSGKMVEAEVCYNPALLKMFDEVVSNSVDEHLRGGKVKNIWVDVALMTGHITIRDDGGIPVEVHPEYGTYIPEMIFGELLSGSNFDDDDRITAGTHGLGAKLTNIFSTEFKVDTCDGKNRFVQVFRNNLSERGKAVIQPHTVAGTTITFLPDYKRFDCELDDGNLKKIERRVHDVAGCNPTIKVFYNGSQIKISKVAEYGAMFSDKFIFDAPTDTFTVGVAPSVEDSFQHVSFVNGIDTFNGGTHVNYVSDQITQKIREFIKKKHKVDVKPNTIKQQMFVFIKCTINAPMFTSQTKEFMSSEIRNYGTSWAPSDKFIKKLIESEVVQKVLDWVEGEKRREELAQMRKLNTQTQNTNFLKRIVKFDDATSKARNECTIFFTEGDCLHEDEEIQVYSEDGIKDVRIKDVQIGDMVLTHKNRLMPVVNKNVKIGKSYSIKFGGKEIICSGDHRWLIYNKDTLHYEFRRTSELRSGNHTLVKNQLADIQFIEPIDDFKLIDKFQDGVLYECIVIVGDIEYLFTLSHRVLVFDVDTGQFKMLVVRDIKMHTHMLVFG